MTSDSHGCTWIVLYILYISTHVIIMINNNSNNKYIITIIIIEIIYLCYFAHRIAQATVS